MVAVLLLTGCTGTNSGNREQRSESLQSALDHYSRLVEGMQSDSIAALYLPDGELTAEGQAPVVGPDAIRTFLHGFDNYKILSEALTVDSSSVEGDRGFQRGHFAQTVILPAGDTVSVAGRFTADWVLDPAGNWHVRRMATAPPT